jgi:hypothetical protein
LMGTLSISRFVASSTRTVIRGILYRQDISSI